MLSKKLPILALLVAAWCWTSEANTYYDVACTGVNSELQCPEGKLIDVLSVTTGTALNADCNTRTQPARISGAACLHSQMLMWTKSICDNLNRCHLSKPNVEMFTCPMLLEPFIQIEYTCKVKNPELKEVVACENDAAALKCETGVIAVVKANYGRLEENTCINGTSSMTFCSSILAQEVVKEKCNLEKECEILASSETMGIPLHCDLFPKYLYASYICI